MVKTYQMYIGGKWVDASSGQTFDDMNPYTGEVYACLQAGKREDAVRAIAADQPGTRPLALAADHRRHGALASVGAAWLWI